ncbi:hypothetical protein FRIGORI9N_400138 [Frigoribacterium sp. 9N]|nr:hypothetical protein FRIGORI9N_400138 [Frigoribacterium sp. 9N]
MSSKGTESRRTLKVNKIIPAAHATANAYKPSRAVAFPRLVLECAHRATSRSTNSRTAM